MFLNSYFFFALLFIFQYKRHLTEAYFVHGSNYEQRPNDSELIEELQISYKQDEIRTFPNRFTAQFKAFEKNFSIEFVRIDKKSPFNSVQSSKVFTLNSRNELEELKISQDQVVKSI